MTVLCGLARSVGQLALARLGVGAMEPGATPPAQSLIADYFPPDRRGRALALVLAGASVGNLLGVALGGYIAGTYGWRNSFLMAGALGLVLAAFTRWGLAEPRSRLGFPAANRQAETLGQAILRLRRKQSFLLTLVGYSIFVFFSVGVGTFLPSFMIRTMHTSLTEVSVTWGIAYSIANIIGTLCGGWLADRLSRRDIRWYAWLSAIACVLGALLYWLALSCNSLWGFIAIDFLAEFTLAVGTMAAWPAIHALCGSQRRGMAVAVVQFAYILVGAGLGPLAAGVLSDTLSAAYGSESLRFALNVMTFVLLFAAVTFYSSGRRMPRELEQ